MSIRTVMCVFSVDGWDQDAKSACEFCEARGAHMNAIVLCVSIPAVSTFEAFSMVWLDQQQSELERLSEEMSSVKSFLERTGLSYDVRDIYTEFAWAEADIASHALYADLVLVGAQAAANDELYRRIIDGALFESPTPILINPRSHPLASFPKSMLLAWDSSDEASRAARQSMELLKECEIVHVTLVDPIATSYANGEEPGADVATFLSRHGVKVEVDCISSGGRPVDQALRQHAMDVAADMVVMGAYNHPRIQQRLFGGVTRSMLKDSGVPLFISH